MIEIDADWMRWKALQRSVAAIEATEVMRSSVDQADKFTSLSDCLWAEYEAMSYQLEKLWGVEATQDHGIATRSPHPKR